MLREEDDHAHVQAEGWTEEKVDENDLHKEGPLAHLGTTLDREALSNALVLIRQDTRKTPVVRVFRRKVGIDLIHSDPIYEEVEHYFVNPPGI